MYLFLITHPPDSPQVEVGMRVAAACAGYGHQIHLFFAGEGTLCLDKIRSTSEILSMLEELLCQNVGVSFCAQDAEKMGCGEMLDQAEASSLIQLGKLIPKSATCLCF